MKTSLKWGAVIVLLLAIVLMSPWQATGALSTKLNAADNMSENIATLLTLFETGTTAIGKVEITDGTDDVLVNASKELQVDDDAGNVLLGTIDADTDAIKTATEGIEDEIDGTTTTGPLDIIRAVDEGRATAASGQTLDCDLSDVDTVTGLLADEIYKVTSIDGIVLMGIASVGAGGVTTANVLWIITAGTTQYITIPAGQTIVHYSALTEDVTAFWVQVINK